MSIPSTREPRHFATVITESHLGYAKTVLASLARHGSAPCRLHCLVVDGMAARGSNADDSLRLYGRDDLPQDDVTRAIFERYASTDPDALRWSLKAAFVRHLVVALEAPVAFVDPDQYFVDDAEPLFTFASGSVFRVSPHWRPIDPSLGDAFLTQLTDGLYNGGLFVARPGAEALLSWWATACAWRCEKSPWTGLYVDQKYLDVVPVYFEGVEVIRHKGFNVASWNRHHLPRTSTREGIRVAGDPLVSVHFSGSTVRDIRHGLDPALAPVLRAYEDELASNGAALPPSPPPAEPAVLRRLAGRLVGAEGKAKLRAVARTATRRLAELSARLQR